MKLQGTTHYLLVFIRLAEIMVVPNAFLSFLKRILFLWVLCLVILSMPQGKIYTLFTRLC